jgi:hypothetical protein
VRSAIAAALGRPRRVAPACHHTPPARFRPGEALAIELFMEKTPASVRLFYRHVNHAERYQSQEMEAHDNRYRSAIPAEYTNSPYPLQYYFEVSEQPQMASLYPGFPAALNNQPYYVVRRG